VYSGELKLVEKAMQICRTLGVDLSECNNFGGTSVLDYKNEPSANPVIVELINSFCQ